MADRPATGTADPGVDLVEDQRRRRALVRQRHLQRQQEARQLASTTFIIGPARAARIGLDVEFDPVDALRPRRASRCGRSGTAPARASAPAVHAATATSSARAAVSRAALSARLGAIVRLGRLDRRLQRRQPLLAVVEIGENPSSSDPERRQRVDRAGMFARRRLSANSRSSVRSTRADRNPPRCCGLQRPARRLETDRGASPIGFSALSASPAGRRRCAPASASA